MSLSLIRSHFGMHLALHTLVTMLKITLHDSALEFRLKLEGRLSGLWVRELEQSWKTASSTTHGRKTVLDLAEVDFVDPDGESLLASMHAEGVELVGVTPLICAVLQEICRAPACGTVEKAGSTP
jgi:anti-anti-sigma regulatory factor